MTKQQRTVADETRLKILEAAKLSFLEKGYDGTSINGIAKLAEVNKTLIFHHFDDKANLWRKVKETIIESVISKPAYDMTSARTYFESVLTYRFNLYTINPELARLIAWQQISDEHDALIGNDYASPTHWLKDIKSLQKQGQLKKDIDAKLIMLFVIYSSHAPFMQNIYPLTQKQKETYKNIIVESCLSQFSAHH